MTKDIPNKENLEKRVEPLTAISDSCEFTCKSRNSLYVYHGQNDNSRSEPFEVYTKNGDGEYAKAPMIVYGWARVSDSVLKGLVEKYNALKHSKQVNIKKLLELVSEGKRNSYDGPNSRFFLAIGYAGAKDSKKNKVGIKMSSYLSPPDESESDIQFNSNENPDFNEMIETMVEEAKPKQVQKPAAKKESLSSPVPYAANRFKGSGTSSPSKK